MCLGWNEDGMVREMRACLNLKAVTCSQTHANECHIPKCLAWKEEADLDELIGISAFTQGKHYIHRNCFSPIKCGSCDWWRRSWASAFNMFSVKQRTKQKYVITAVIDLTKETMRKWHYFLLDLLPQLWQMRNNGKGCGWLTKKGSLCPLPISIRIKSLQNVLFSKSSFKYGGSSKHGRGILLVTYAMQWLLNLFLCIGPTYSWGATMRHQPNCFCQMYFASTCLNIMIFSERFSSRATVVISRTLDVSYYNTLFISVNCDINSVSWCETDICEDLMSHRGNCEYYF